MEPGERSPHHDQLEDSFFGRDGGGLRERLREAERTRTARMESLAEVSGITDVEVLEKLVGLGVRSETLTALSLYPLVAVAWADGHVDRHERETVLQGAADDPALDRDAVRRVADLLSMLGREAEARAALARAMTVPRAAIP